MGGTLHSPAAGRRLPGRQRRLRRWPVIATGERRRRAAAALEQLEGVPGRLQHVAGTARGGDSLCRLRPHARRAEDRAGRCARMPPAGYRRVRLRRRPRPRQAARDGRASPPAWPTWSSSPTTIRAAKTRPRSAPQILAGAPARARSATAAKRSAPPSRAARRRRAGGRRQGPRDRVRSSGTGAALRRRGRGAPRRGGGAP